MIHRLQSDRKADRQDKSNHFKIPSRCRQSRIRSSAGASFLRSADNVRPGGKETDMHASGQIKILIACHREYPVPDDPCYLPITVGAALRAEAIPGFASDDTGDNISDRNKHYCELTALYWAWKNLDAEYIGLVQYRRYFSKKRFSKQLAAEADFRKALEKAPVILPAKRRYWIETIYTQYIHAHHEQDLAVTRAVIAERCPAYLAAYDRKMRRRSGHAFNMLVMRRDLLDAYCSWLFPVLFEVEKRLDISAYDAYNSRVFGFIAERLLDVWLETKRIPYTQMPVLVTEKQHWLKKGTAFVRRKITYRVRKHER